MKKNYMKPSIKVANVEAKTLLITGSVSGSTDTVGARGRNGEYIDEEW